MKKIYLFLIILFFLICFKENFLLKSEYFNNVSSGKCKCCTCGDMDCKDCHLNFSKCCSSGLTGIFRYPSQLN